MLSVRTGELGENRIVSGATVARRNKAGNRSRALSIEERLGGWGGVEGKGGGGGDDDCQYCFGTTIE